MSKKNESDTNESKEVAVKQSTEVSTEMSGMFDNTLQSSGDTMDAEDIRIPKLTLIQGMTKASFNTEGAPVGNFINSIEKMDMGNELEMFVMSDVKLWQFDYMAPQGKNKADKKEYLTITDFEECPDIRKNFSPNNLPQIVKDKMQAKELRVEQMCKPDLIHRFYVVLVNEVKDGIAFPYIVDFKRSSVMEGNKLKNIFYKMRKCKKMVIDGKMQAFPNGLPSYAKIYTLTSEFVQDEFDYYVKKVNSGRFITADETVAVEGWARELQGNADKYVADESDAVDEDVVEAEHKTVEATVVDDNEKPKF